MSTASAEIHLFYGYWQLIVCSFSGVALLAIWRHLTRRSELPARDRGMVWLAIAVMVWALSGLVEIGYARHLLRAGATGDRIVLYKGLESMLSIFNSAFILLALPRFRHTPRLIRPVIRSDSWRLLVGVTFAFSAVITALMLVGVLVPSRITFIYSVDFIYAVFTLFFLGLVFWASFDRRQLKTLAYLSAAAIICTLLAQMLKLGGSDFFKVVLSCTFKTILIMLFFALALSWSEELSRTAYLPRPDEMHALLLQRGGSARKQKFTAILTIPPLLQTQQIVLTEKPFQLLQVFVQRRREEGQQGGWLEIQPKSAPLRPYDIKDYNEIGRLLDTILNNTLGTGNWTADVEKKSLKEALFEYGQQRNIRLRIAPENLRIES